jgi:hypothetical protein
MSKYSIYLWLRVIASSIRIISEWWIEKDVNGNGCGLIWGTATILPVETEGNHKKLKVVVSAKIQTGHFSNTNQKFYCLSQLAGR